MDVKYKEFFHKVLQLRGDGIIRHSDITTLIAMMQWIDFDTVNDVKNKRLVNITDIDKSNISKSIKTLIKAGIVIENDKGYRLNDNISYD